MQRAVAVVLGGGRGSRLFPLTRERSKPAVPLAGKYRLVDVTLSNCINSDIRQIYVLTMFQSASLNAHLASTYRFDAFSRGFVTVLAAEQRADGAGNWFQGTADAVRRAWMHLEGRTAQQVLVLPGDHLVRMDYRAFAARHAASRADVSLAVHPVSREQAHGLGVLRVDGEGRAVDFVEKPSAAELDRLACDTTVLGLTPAEARARPFVASMGTYLFGMGALKSLLAAEPAYTDFGRHLIPAAVRAGQVATWCFPGYWADLGTVRSFYEAHMDLVGPLPRFDLFDPDMPVYTHTRHLPGAKVGEARVERSMLCEGAIVEGATVRGSILGLRSRILRGATIEDALVMGADRYQPADEAGRGLGVGEGATVRHAIVDKDASIGAGVCLVNRRGLTTYDDPAGRWFVRDGIIVVGKGAVIPAGTEF